MAAIITSGDLHFVASAPHERFIIERMPPMRPTSLVHRNEPTPNHGHTKPRGLKPGAILPQPKTISRGAAADAKIFKAPQAVPLKDHLVAPDPANTKAARLSFPRTYHVIRDVYALAGMGVAGTQLRRLKCDIYASQYDCVGLLRKIRPILSRRPEIRYLTSLKLTLKGELSALAGMSDDITASWYNINVAAYKGNTEALLDLLHHRRAQTDRIDRELRLTQERTTNISLEIDRAVRADHPTGLMPPILPPWHLMPPTSLDHATITGEQDDAWRSVMRSMVQPIALREEPIFLLFDRPALEHWLQMYQQPGVEPGLFFNPLTCRLASIQSLQRIVLDPQVPEHRESLDDINTHPQP